MPGSEECRFGGEVLFHAAVQVQVVLGQVGETSHVEHHGVNPAEGQGMGRNLHGGAIQALLGHDGQQGMHIGGLRRGQLAGNGLAAGQDLNGANEPCCFSQRPQQGVQEIGGGGLAVGSRHGKQVQAGSVPGPACSVYSGRNGSHGTAHVCNGEHGDSHRCPHQSGSGVVRQDRHRTRGNRLGGKFRAMGP